MESKCFLRIGNIAIDASGILDCSIYENLGYFPWGSIRFVDKMKLVEANFDFKEYTEIEITLGAYEGNEKSEIVFKADIASTSVRKSKVLQSSHEIELTFILRGTNGNLLSQIKPSAYQGQSSISVIKDICKTAGVKLNVDPKLQTQDAMSWLIVNHNFLTAINYLCDRSYVPDSALVYNISLTGEISLYSLKDKLNSKPVACFMVAPPTYRNAAMNNGSTKLEDMPMIYFHDGGFKNESGLNRESSSIEIREVSVNPKKNKMESTSKTLAPGGGSGHASNVILYQPSLSPQITGHEKYAIAPAYRKAVIATYGLTMDLEIDNETFTRTGDCVTILDGSFDSTGKYIQSKMSSGTYIVLRKGYHFSRNIGSGQAGFQTTIQLITNIAGIG